MRSVTGTEVASKLPCVGNGHTAEVGAHPDDDQPLWFGDPVCVKLRISETGYVHGPYSVDFVLRAVTYEEGLPLPLKYGVLPLRNGGDVHFDLCQCEDVGGSAHGGKEVHDDVLCRVNRSNSTACHYQVSEGTPARIARGVCGILTAVSSIGREIWDCEVRVASPSRNDGWGC